LDDLVLFPQGFVFEQDRCQGTVKTSQ
jgi:hypothetical protein